MIVVARLVERRWLVPSQQYLSFFYGDIALGVAALAGGWTLTQTNDAAAVFSAPWLLVTIAAGSLAFGLVSWRLDASAADSETGKPVYTRSMLRSPTKIWHNTVCYLVLGPVSALVTAPALLSGSGGGDPGIVWPLRALIIGCFGFWIWAATVWDPKHIKPHAHVNHDWRHTSST
jgi:hypothetical protein